jgi:hypothetical protein
MLITRPRTFGITDPNQKRFVEDIYKVVNGRNISFGEQVNSGDQNINGMMVENLNTGAANTSVAFTHNLGRVPKFIDFKYKNISGDWYDSGTAWTTTQVFVKFTTANMHVRLFIH